MLQQTATTDVQPHLHVDQTNRAGFSGKNISNNLCILCLNIQSYVHTNNSQEHGQRKYSNKRNILIMIDKDNFRMNRNNLTEYITSKIKTFRRRQRHRHHLFITIKEYNLRTASTPPMQKEHLRIISETSDSLSKSHPTNCNSKQKTLIIKAHEVLKSKNSC